MTVILRSPPICEPLRATGAKAALFLVHAMGGTVGCYRPLTARLPDNRPVHGFRAPRPDELHDDATVHNIAEIYTRALMACGGTGIVHLAGWSMGGLIALEMARLLRAQGRLLGMVALIDTWMRREHLLPVRPPDHLRILDRRRWRVFHKLVTGSVGILDDDNHLFWQLDKAQRIEFIARAAATANPRRYGDGGEQFASDMTAYMRLREASDNYRPERAAGKITLVLADEERDLESAAVWRTLIDGEVEVVVSRGSHLTIVDEPNVSTLASLLEATMDAAQAHVEATARIPTRRHAIP
jgi:thioesterase domain-containing protein